MTPEIVGQKIKESREHLGLSLRDLEERTGFNRGWISRVEAGSINVGISNLAKLAEALGLKLSLEKV